MPTVDGSTVAFVPDPIPTRLTLEARTIVQLSKADYAVGALSGLTAAVGESVNPFLVGTPLLHREAILSSRIEGTHTTPEELVLFEADPDQTAATSAESETREVANYVRAMRFAVKRTQQIPLSLRLIREVHERLLDGVRGNRDRPGEFRKSQNWIGAPTEPIQQARFVPPPVLEMEACLHSFEKSLHAPGEELPPLVHLALAHYQFEAIHPFRDGNGRMGRLLLPLVLCAQEQLEEPHLYLSAYFERHRQQYYDLMLAVSQRGEWDGWVRFFLRGVEESARESRQKAQGLLSLRHDYHQKLHSARSSALLLKLTDRLFLKPSITMGQASEFLEISPAAASANIRKLVDAGILRKVEGRSRPQRFIADGILKFIEDSGAS